MTRHFISPISPPPTLRGRVFPQGILESGRLLYASERIQLSYELLATEDQPKFHPLIVTFGRASTIFPS
jgi:hypothetical protein